MSMMYLSLISQANGVQLSAKIPGFHSSAVARDDSDENVLGFSHNPTVDSVAIFVDEQTTITNLTMGITQTHSHG